jgi:phosphoserine phosphatase
MGIAFRAKPLVRQTASHAVSFLGLDSLLYLIGVRDRDLAQCIESRPLSLAGAE